MTPRLTPATLAFLDHWAESQARYALRCPAIAREAAREYGTEAALYMAREIKAGTFTHLDGEPCLVEAPPSLPVPNREAQQLRLGEEAA